MTVKELKEKLEQFPDNCIVMIPNQESHLTLTFPYPIWYLPATNVAQGTNEEDGCVFISHIEDEA